MHGNLIKSKNSLYKEFGGKEAVDKVSIHFLKKVLSDDSINDLYIDTDIQTLMREFKALVAFFVDAPITNRNKPLEIGRHHFVKRKLGNSNFNTLEAHLQDTLKELNYSCYLIEKILIKAEKIRIDLINEYRKVIIVGLLKINDN